MSDAAIPVLPHVRVLRERYAVWLCDVWGVVHNGVRPFASAVEALIAFRRTGGRVVLLTNAPRPMPPVLRQLAKIGVPDQAFDLVVTSGDATRSRLRELGATPVLHIGPRRDRALFADLGLNLAEPGDAEIVLCTGLNDESKEVSAYGKLLDELKRRGAALLCANPDIVVDRAGTLVPCAGALAQAYELIGGRVAYFGKPHAPIYDLAMARLADIMDYPPRRDEILAIGDGLKTDMDGAADAGFDALFIAAGIHLGEIGGAQGGIDSERLAGLFAGARRAPVAAQHMLAW